MREKRLDNQMKVLETLFVMFALLLPVSYVSAVSAEEPGQAHEYVGARKCKSCHGKEGIGNQYDSWLATSHAKALDTLATDEAKKWASEANIADPQNDEKCVKCHVTAYGVPAEQLGRKFDRTEGVQCEACHGAGKDYRKKKYMVDREVAESRGMIPQNADVCLGCHNDESPAWDPERYTLADGTKSGFDYDQAVAAIAHPVPEGYDPAAEDEAD